MAGQSRKYVPGTLPAVLAGRASAAAEVVTAGITGAGNRGSHFRTKILSEGNARGSGIFDIKTDWLDRAASGALRRHESPVPA